MYGSDPLTEIYGSRCILCMKKSCRNLALKTINSYFKMCSYFNFTTH